MFLHPGHNPYKQHNPCKLFAVASLVPVLVSGFFAPSAHAATTAEKVKHLDHLLSAAHLSQDVVYVDDMRFKANTLQSYRDRLDSSTLTRAAVNPWVSTWAGGVVPYTYDASVSGAHRAEFEAAIREWQLVANVNFVPRTTEADYLAVISGYDGNWSWVGKVGGAQELHIQQWSDTGAGSQAKFLICHEIGHALGLIHEQSREDRDNYVTIRAENIDTVTYGPDAVYNFDIVPGSLNQGTYDFDSIMHYRKDTFARPWTVTIEAQSAYSNYQDQMGQLTHLSVLDKSGMAKIYGAARAISGAVKTDGGVTLSGATMRITGASPYRDKNPMANAANGSYIFRGIPSSTYTVSAVKSGYFMLPSAMSVKIATANATGVDFIALQGTRITGRITKGTSTTGLVGAVVTRRNLATGAEVSVTTNSKGYYGFSNVPTGTGVAYTLVVSKAGYVFSTTSVLPLSESVPTNYDNVNFSGLLSTSTYSGTSS